MGQTGRRSIATHILAVKIVSAAAHFHGFGVARQGPWNTWVNSDGHRAPCTRIRSWLSATCRAQATASPSSWPCSSCLHLLGGAAFAVCVGVALARSDQLRALRLVLLRGRVVIRRGAGLSSWLRSPLSSPARRSLPLRWHSTPSARRRSATWRLRRGSPRR